MNRNNKTISKSDDTLTLSGIKRRNKVQKELDGGKKRKNRGN
jgi:hypothetical protein